MNKRPNPSLRSSSGLIPPLPEPYLHRPRLDQAFSQGTFFFLLCARGYGKTTAVASWALGQHDPVIWVAAGGFPREGDDLWRRFLGAIGVSAPEAPVSDFRYWNTLADRLLHLPVASIVLDDFQNAPSGFEDNLRRFLDILPGGWRFFLLGTRTPAFEITTLRISGRLVLFEEAELAMTLAETSELLPEVPNDEVGWLYAQTEGWLAGLVLYRRLGADHDFNETKVRFRHEVRKLLAEQLLVTLSSMETKALVLASQLEELGTDELAIATGDPALSVALAQVAQRHAFVTYQSSGTYRLHPLLRDCLRSSQSAGGQEILHLGRYLWHHERYVESARTMAMGFPSEVSARLVAEAPRWFTQGHLDRLESVLSTLPEVHHTPAIHWIAGELYRQTGRLELSERALFEAQQGFEAIQDEQGLCETYMVQAAINGQQGRYLQQGTLIERALRGLQTPSPARAFALNVLGNHLLLGSREPARAMGAFQEALSLYRDMGDTLGQARLMHNLAVLQTRHGRLGGALEIYENIHRLLRDQPAPRFSWITRANHALLQTTLGQPETGARSSRETLDALCGLGLSREEGEVLRSLAFALIAMEKWEEADQILQQALMMGNSSGDQAGIKLSWHFLSFLHLRSGRIEESFEASQQVWPALQKEVTPSILELAQIRAQLYLERGELDACDELMKGILTLSRSNDYAYHLYQALLTEARRRDIVGDVERKDRARAEAELLARRWGYVEMRLPSPSRPQPLLQIRLFGPFEVKVAGVPIARAAWRTPKARLLLGYLIEHPTGASKAQLLELLYPEGSSDTSIGVTVMRLRRALSQVDAPGEPITFTDGHYRWNALTSAWIDSQAFCSAFAGRRWQEAIDLYRGEFLAEFDLPWVQAIRQQYQNKAIEAVNALILNARDNGDHENVLVAAQRGLAWEPCAEELHETMIESFVALGRPQLALQQYALCRQILLERLGTEPSPALTRAINRIRGS